MTYAVSDLHGCFDKYKQLLDKLCLSDNDTLYILGDIVDRGDGGIEIIKDVIKRKNIVALKGNHEYMAATMLKAFAIGDNGYFSEELKEGLVLWFKDGGQPTIEGFRRLNARDKSLVFRFLTSLPSFKRLEVNGRKYFLSHTVPEKEKMMDFENCAEYNFIIGEPEYEKQYYADTFIVTGHTPTGFIDEAYTGKIWQGNNHIDIDCGAVFGNRLGCICLDTMEEIYV